MSNLTIFCLTLNPDHGSLIKNISYKPVGLGSRKFSKDFLSDDLGLNISVKNSFYGEYTFHYWIWKNYLDNINTQWVGFCQYRKFFTVNKNIQNLDNFNNFNNSLVKNITEEYRNFDCILGEKFSVENYKLSKILKNHFFSFISDPNKLFNKKKRSLKFHFDLFHGKGNLDQAIDMLDEENKNDFKEFMHTKTSFNPHNMFICKKDILKKYYEVIFPWLKKCETIFGFNGLKGYGLTRIYGFLAERFLSYWFNKNFKIKELPIIFKDLSDYR